MTDSQAQSNMTKPPSDGTVRRSAGMGRRRYPGTEPDGLSPAFLVAAVSRWWPLAAVIGLVVSTLACAVIWWTFEPVYRASALLQIREQVPYIVQPVQQTSKRFVQTQIEILRSPLVLAPVLSEPAVARLPLIRSAKDPVKTIARHIRVTSVGGSELYEVTFDDPVPSHAAVILNAVIDKYLELRSQNDATRVQRVIELLEEEKNRRAADLARLREEIRELGKKVLGRDPLLEAPSGGARAGDQALAAIQTRLATAEAERQILEAQVRAYQELVAKAQTQVPDLSVEAALEADPQIQQLRSLIQGKHLVLQQIEVASARGRQDPAYQRLLREIREYEKSIEDLRGSLRPAVRQKLEQQARLKQQEELVRLQNLLENARVTEQTFRQRYEEQARSLGESSAESIDLAFKQDELAREENVYNLIAQRAMALRAEQRAPERVTLLKKATPPAVPVEWVPLKTMGIAVLVSFFLPLAALVLWERQIQRINTAEQLESQAELSVVGEICTLPTRANGRRKSKGDYAYGTIFEESVDSLRTCLVLSSGYADVMVLAVTSAVSGEGKTSVAAQLAASLARSTHEKTLLIDADMRCPDMHRIFKVPNDVGLADLLAGSCALAEAIVTDWNEHLHLLPAGRLKKNPHELLGNGSCTRWLDRLRQTYRYIIIDTPPILSASEALVVARAADAAIICAMRDVSRSRQIRMAYERLVATGARPIGAVLSGVPRKRYSSTYGNYHYSRG